jgi:hypothetical protein
LIPLIFYLYLDLVVAKKVEALVEKGSDLFDICPIWQRTITAKV